MNEVRQVDRVGEAVGVSNVERETPWRLVKGRVHLSLPAGAGCGAARTASKQAYGRLLFRHHPSLGGVVVAHAGEVKIVAGPKYVTTSPFAHVAAETTLLLFAPCVGCVLAGTVTYVGPDHLGLTVHSAFHAVLPYEDVAPHYIYTRLSDSSARWQRMLSSDGPDFPSATTFDDDGKSDTDYVIGARVRFVVTGVQTTRSGLYQLFGSVKGGSNSSTSVTGKLGVIRKEEPIVQSMEGPTGQMPFGEEEQLESVLAGLNARKKRRRHEGGPIAPTFFSTPSGVVPNVVPNVVPGNAHPLLSSNALTPPSFTHLRVRQPVQGSTSSMDTRALPRVASPPRSMPSPPQTPSVPLTPPPPPTHAPPEGPAPELPTDSVIAYEMGDAKTEAQIAPVVPTLGLEGSSRAKAKEEIPTQGLITAQVTRASPGKVASLSEKKRKKKRKADASAGFGDGQGKVTKRAKSTSSTMPTHSELGRTSEQVVRGRKEEDANGGKSAIFVDAVRAVETGFEAQTELRDAQPQSRTKPSPKKVKNRSSKSWKSSKGVGNGSDGVIYKEDKDEKQEQNEQSSHMGADALENIKLSGSHSHLKREAREVTVPKEDDYNEDDIPGTAKKQKAQGVRDKARHGSNVDGGNQTLKAKEKEERRKKKRKKSGDRGRTDHGDGTPKSREKPKRKDRNRSELKSDAGDEHKKKRKSKKSRRSGDVSAVDLDRLRSLGGSSTLANAIFEDVFDAQPPT